MDKKMRKQWLDAAVALQSLDSYICSEEHHDDISGDGKPEDSYSVPQFVLVGWQSTGKTRLLSAFAGRRIGGAERNEVGTRCPVIYRFQTGDDDFSIELVPGHCQKVEEFEIASEIHRHMSHMYGFSERPVLVNITSRICLNSVVVDLPGLKPAVDSPENNTIVRLIQHFISQPRAIPLVLTSLDKFDAEYPLYEIKRVMDVAKMTPATAERAFIFVTKMDLAYDNIRAKTVKNLIAGIQESGIDSDRVVFFSLRPERIVGLVADDGNNEDQGSDDEHAFEQSQVYFSKTIKELEKSANEKMRFRMGVQVGDRMQFGVLKAIELMENFLIGNLERNFEAAIAKLRRWWNSFEELQKTQAKITDEKILREYLMEYINIVTNVLVGTASCDPQLITKCLANSRKDQRFRDYIDDDDDSFANDTFQTLRLSFQEEAELARDADSLDAIQFIFDPKVTKGYDKTDGGRSGKAEAKGVGSHRRGLDFELCGDAAVQRAINLFGYAIMTREMKRFSASEMCDFDGFVGPAVAAGFDTTNVVRKMVNRVRVENRAFHRLIHYCSWLYERQAEVVCQKLRRKIHFLDKSPKLLEYIERKLIGEYVDWFTKACQRMEIRANHILENRFETLRMNELTGVINLLGCCGLTSSLLMTSRHWVYPDKKGFFSLLKEFLFNESSNEDDSVSGPDAYNVKARSSRSGDLSTEEKNDEETVSSETSSSAASAKSAMKLAVTIHRNPEAQIENTFDYFSGMAQISADQFASMDGLKLRPLPTLDSEESIKDLNETAHMLARFSSGLAFMDITSTIQKELITESKDRYHEMRVSMFEVVNGLTDRLDSVTLRKLMADPDLVLEDHRVKAGKIERYLDVARKLNKCCRSDSIQCTELDTEAPAVMLKKLRRQIDQLQKRQEVESMLNTPAEDEGLDKMLSRRSGSMRSTVASARLRTVANIATAVSSLDSTSKRLSSFKFHL